jgi:PQQ-like domain
LAALSVVDGKTLWTTRLASRAQSVQHELRAAGAEVVVSTVAEDFDVEDPEEIGVVASDPADGSPLWKSSGLWPRAVAGDVVLGDVATSAQGDPNSVVGALDGATGEQLWVADRYATSTVEFAAGDVAVISVIRQSTAEPAGQVVIDAKTGAELADLTTVQGRCHTDGRTLVACLVGPEDGPGQLATFDLRERKLSVRPADQLGSVQGVWNGYVFVTALGGVVAVDPAGRKVSGELPGDLVGVADGYAVVRDVDKFAVYRVKSIQR